MIDWTPQAIALQLGPLPLYWYGIAYAVGLFAAYMVMTRQARVSGENAELIGTGIIVVAIAALIGGRLYHVIDQFALYKDDLLKIVLPPYTGLGVYGGFITGLLAVFVLVRRWRLDLWAWTDIIAPGIFTMQAVGRWGNFFNQELYGPPTDLPWGIAIDCAHRVAAYPCESFPLATTHFTPLFLYESVSGLLGALFLIWLASKPRPRLRRGDLLPILLVWYAVVRFALENLRTGNWRLDGIPTAQLFSVAFALVGIALLLYRHATAPKDAVLGVPRVAPAAPEPVPAAPAPSGGADSTEPPA